MVQPWNIVRFCCYVPVNGASGVRSQSSLSALVRRPEKWVQLLPSSWAGSILMGRWNSRSTEISRCSTRRFWVWCLPVPKSQTALPHLCGDPWLRDKPTVILLPQWLPIVLFFLITSLRYDKTRLRATAPLILSHYLRFKKKCKF